MPRIQGHTQHYWNNHPGKAAKRGIEVNGNKAAQGANAVQPDPKVGRLGQAALALESADPKFTQLLHDIDVAGVMDSLEVGPDGKVRFNNADGTPRSELRKLKARIANMNEKQRAKLKKAADAVLQNVIWSTQTNMDEELAKANAAVYVAQRALSASGNPTPDPTPGGATTNLPTDGTIQPLVTERPIVPGDPTTYGPYLGSLNNYSPDMAMLIAGMSQEDLRLALENFNVNGETFTDDPNVNLLFRHINATYLQLAEEDRAGFVTIARAALEERVVDAAPGNDQEIGNKGDGKWIPDPTLDLPREREPGLGDEAAYTRKAILGDANFQLILQKTVGDNITVKYAKDDTGKWFCKVSWGNGDANHSAKAYLDPNINIENASEDTLRKIAGRMIDIHMAKTLGINMDARAQEVKDQVADQTAMDELKEAIRGKPLDQVILLIFLFMISTTERQIKRLSTELTDRQSKVDNNNRIAGKVMEDVLGAGGATVDRGATITTNKDGKAVDEKNKQEIVAKLQHALNLMEQFTSALSNAQATNSRAIVLIANNFKG